MHGEMIPLYLGLLFIGAGLLMVFEAGKRHREAAECRDRAQELLDECDASNRRLIDQLQALVGSERT